MDNEQNLRDRIKEIEEQYEQDKQNWQRQKKEYQDLCAWYAGSLRYQIGDLLIDSIRHPLHLFKFPAQIYRIYKKNRMQDVQKKDMESSVPLGEDKLTDVPILDFGRIEAAASAVTIIIPVFNALEDLKKCLLSIRKYTRFPYEILLVDDGSTQKGMDDYLKKCQSSKRIQVLRMSENKGYPASVNAGVRACNKDVALLNSDTVVTDGWLRKLLIAAYSADDIMTVTPVSNAAGMFSVPQADRNNVLPKGICISEAAKLVERQSWHQYADVPTGNGFCMYVKREAFKRIGYFDERTFGRGYCEENDFCMRLSQAGYRNILCDDTYIYHHRGQSFGNEKHKLLQRNMKILQRRYPQYEYQIQKMADSKQLAQMRKRVQDSFNAACAGEKRKIRILYVIQSAGGGSVKTNEDLMGYVEKQSCETFLLTGDGTFLKLYQYESGAIRTIQIWQPKHRWEITGCYDSEWRNIYFNILFHFHIDLVHIRHLYKHTFDLVDAARWLELPTVLSFHDFYYICPTIHMINRKGVYCSGHCSGSGRCRIDEPAIRIPGSTGKWVREVWRPKSAHIFKGISAFVTTSSYSRRLYEKMYPSLKGKIQVYEHGRDFAYKRKFYGEVPREGEPIRIMLAGNIDYSKGAVYIRELLKCDVDKRLELHCIGNFSGEPDPAIHCYGKYVRENFYDYAVRIRPSYVGIFSIWPETYCHIMTEAFSCGIPCIVSDIGTLRERGKKGGCLLADLEHPKQAYESICACSGDRQAYHRLQREVMEQHIRTIAEMGQDYMQLYQTLLDDERRENRC